MAKLNRKRARFVREYIVDLNATAAAKRAGYSERSAYSQGQRLLNNAEIQTAIAKAQARRAERTEITADRVLQELARIGFADIRDLFEWDEERACYVPSKDLTDDQAAAVSEVQADTTRLVTQDGDTETKIKLRLKTYDKLSALEKIGKHLGMFVDRHEHTGPGGGPIPSEVRVKLVKPDADAD